MRRFCTLSCLAAEFKSRSPCLLDLSKEMNFFVKSPKEESYLLEEEEEELVAVEMVLELEDEDDKEEEDGDGDSFTEVG